MVKDTLSVPAFKLPASCFLQDETREIIEKQKNEIEEKFIDELPSFDIRTIPADQLAEARARLITLTRSLPGYLAMQNRYPTIMSEETIEGVDIEEKKGQALLKRYSIS